MFSPVEIFSYLTYSHYALSQHSETICNHKTCVTAPLLYLGTQGDWAI